MSPRGRDLSRDDILDLLRETGSLLADEGTEASIYVVGGAAMAMVFDSRRTTVDVDAGVWGDPEAFWRVARAVGDRHGLGEDWVNSRATAFLSAEPDGAASEINLPGLRVLLASPRHLMAMKLRALRDRDLDDLVILFRALEIRDPQEAADIHDELFDESAIGYGSPEESLYAAQLVFDHARRSGRPLRDERSEGD